MKITVSRTKEWVQRERLERGSNVPDSVVAMVDPADLCKQARAALLEAGGGSYCDIPCLRFNSLYEITPYSGHGTADIIVDAEVPTTEQIEDAILDAVDRIADRRDEAAAREAEAEAKRLADELAQLEKAKRDLRTVAGFLSEIPKDALRGTLKRLASGDEAAASVRKRIEDASPVWIFNEID